MVDQWANICPVYPDKLYKLHNYQPLAPEKLELEINHNTLSNYCISIDCKQW